MKIPIQGKEIVFPEPQNKAERVETPKVPQETKESEETQETENRMSKEDLLLKIRVLRRNITDLGDQVKKKRVLLVDENRISKEMSVLSAMNLLDQLNMELQYLEGLAINYFNIKKEDLQEMERKSIEVWEWEI